MRGEQRLRDCITLPGFLFVFDARPHRLLLYTKLNSIPLIHVFTINSYTVLRLALFFILLKQRLDLFEELSYLEKQKEKLTRT